jgi:hypothetical protein
MVRQGVSPRALAKMLDHSDVQNVQVYFDLRNDIVGLLDKAASEKIDWLIDGFKKPLENNAASSGGAAELLSNLHLNSPFACYACQKFRPYSEEIHQYIYKFLKKLPKPKPGTEGLGLQLEDVIEAVAQVIEFLKAGGGR